MGTSVSSSIYLPSIDLLSMYVLFSYFRPCNDTAENVFFQIPSYLRAYVCQRTASILPRRLRTKKLIFGKIEDIFFFTKTARYPLRAVASFNCRPVWLTKESWEDLYSNQKWLNQEAIRILACVVTPTAPHLLFFY